MTKQTDRPAHGRARRRLTPPALALLWVLALPGAALAQWTQPDANNNTHNNPTSGNVGVGTANPLYGKLQVNKSVRIDDDTGSASGSDTITAAPSLYIGTTAGGGHLQYNSGGGLDLWQYHQGDWRRTITFARTGWVGIGTTSPMNQFHVDGGPGLGAVRVSGAGAAVMNFRDNGAGAGAKQYQLRSAGGRFHLSLTADDEQSYARPDILVATSAGHVGVGTANPIRGLHVSGANDTGAEFILENRGLAPDNRKLNLWGDTAGGAGRFYLRLINDAATAVTREFLAFDNATGNVGVGTTAPEERLHVNGKVKATGLCLGEVCKGSWSEVGGSQWANGASGAITYGSGNVGIGTASPGTLLHLAAPSSGPQMRFGVDANTSLMQFWKDSPVTRTASIGLQSPGGGLSDDLIFSTYTNATGAWSPRLTIKNGGNVGIGTGAADPGAKLEVNAGSAEAVAIKATGTIMADNIVAKFQDVAEWVPSVQKLSPGTVVILDAGRVNHVLASSSAYDTKVAGVVSAQPGVILGVGGEGKVMVATTGRVKVRADASRGAIRVGDLLVTSGVEGVAMKSVPVELGGTQIHRPGTIIGKALEPLEKGVGEILVLLSLQ